MLAVTNVLGTARPPTGAYVDGAATLSGAAAGRGSPYTFLWNATARDSDPGETKYQEATRTASTCYMVGLKERILIQTSDANPWEWRRICFCAKGRSNIFQASAPGAIGQQLYYEDNNGFRRQVTEPSNSSLGVIRDILFDGAYGVDWNDPFSAKTDRQRVTIKYDKTRMIRSTNNVGVIRYYNMWHPMKKNLSYDDDENGEGQTSSYVSQAGNAGMGDFYVIDFIRCIDGPTGTPQLLFQPEATLYWHER